MLTQPSAYEVRCPRCDVSFPAETRQCMHCGGRTSAPGRIAIFDTLSEMRGDQAEPSMDTDFAIPSEAERELGVSDEPSSMGRSLIRSLGGFVWIIVLIGFTLARNCGEN